MAYDARTTNLPASAGERCDIKIWSGDCRQSDGTSSAGKYLCTSCGTISTLDHEVRHEIFPHVSGDVESLY